MTHIHDASPVKTPVQARQGETSGHMRWVVIGSTLLAVVVLGALYFAYMG